MYFSHLMTPAEVDYVIRAVLEVARDGWKLAPQYDIERRSGAHVIVIKKWRARCACNERVRVILHAAVAAL